MAERQPGAAQGGTPVQNQEEQDLVLQKCAHFLSQYTSNTLSLPTVHTSAQDLTYLQATPPIPDPDHREIVESIEECLSEQFSDDKSTEELQRKATALLNTLIRHTTFSGRQLKPLIAEGFHNTRKNTVWFAPAVLPATGQQPPLQPTEHVAHTQWFKYPTSNIRSVFNNDSDSE